MRLFFLLLVVVWSAHGQAPFQPNAAEIKLKIQKLNFLGSVLYVAAHPDDENTAMITYLSKGKLASTAYLSMTRGDGGQNLIGSEIGEQLGLIRTQELLAARRIDGGDQFFTRANDFGFSKSAEETFKIWGKDAILSDVVRVFREYQPDVILTRFPPDERAGHGHHTASAMLAIEAFDAAASNQFYADQLSNTNVWQPKRLFINTGRFFNNTINEKTPGVVTVDVGGYNTLLGSSYNEISADSRSQHKSQGFGSSSSRGYRPEFLELVKGEAIHQDIFDGVNTSWTRVKGGERVRPLVERLISEFQYEKPSASIPLLFQIRNEIINLETSVWKLRKLREVEQLIQDCAGLYIEITSTSYWISPGESVSLSVELINRSDADVKVEAIHASDISFDSTLNVSLQKNVGITIKSRKILTSAKEYSNPYWLKEPHSIGTYTVNQTALIGKPENEPAVQVEFKVKIGSEIIIIKKPLVHRSTDPVKGEQYRPVEVVPPVFVNISNGVWVFGDEKPKEVPVVIKSSVERELKGTLRLVLPEGWRSEPASFEFAVSKRGEERTKVFKVYPSRTEYTGVMKAVAEVNQVAYRNSLQLISYDHIPIQTLLPSSETKVVRVSLKKEGSVVGYIKGAGDDVPNALRNMGYEVWEMKDEEVTADNLKKVDAVVLGIRAFNTNDRIRFMMNDLLEYVKIGGTLIVQYNTNNGINPNTVGPYPITLSRDRVTEEDAEVRLLKPEHPLLNSPNKITPADFNGWVQERGLYFPGKWDEKYETLLSMNDTKDKPMEGSLLVANYGNGYYVYTGLSFFRELPEGVPGAYKLFANIVSLGKPKKQDQVKMRKR